MARQRVRWQAPAAKDFAAAHSYLSLVFPATRSAGLVRALRHARTVTHSAKDLLRASGLALLPREDARVGADLKRIRKGKALAPVLLVQGDLDRGLALVVADGYHRICAVCYFDEDSPVSCLRVPC
jgi:hypothetical protein